VARIAALHAEHKIAAQALQKAEAAAAIRLEAARKAFEAADQEFSLAAGARKSASVRCSDAIARLERVLRESADPAVGEFALEMEGLWERERRESSSGQRVGSGQYDLRGAEQVKILSDRGSRVRRLSAIRAAQLEARDVIALEVHTPDSLARRLERIRNDLPTIKMEPVSPGDTTGIARAAA